MFASFAPSPILKIFADTSKENGATKSTSLSPKTRSMVVTFGLNIFVPRFSVHLEDPLPEETGIQEAPSQKYTVFVSVP